MYKWFMAWRYLYTKLIAIFAVLGVALCVAMVLVVLSVMGGFLDTMKERSRGLLADVILDAGTLQGWPFYQEFAEHLKTKLPGDVKLATPVVHNYGIFRVPDSTYTKPARVVGIRLGEYSQVNTFGEGLHYDTFFPGTTHLGKQKQPVAGFDDRGVPALPDDLREANALWRQQRKAEGDLDAIAEYDKAPFSLFPLSGDRVFDWGDVPGYAGREFDGVIVGCDLLNQRKADGSFERPYPRGMTMALTLMPLTQRGNPASELAVKLPLRYADDSRTGVYEIDSACVYVGFDALQHVLAMDAQPLVDGGQSKPRTTQLLITLNDGVDLVSARNRIEDAWIEFLVSLGNKPTEMERRLLGFVEVQTWEDMQRTFIIALEKEKILMTILFGLISVVAVVLIGCIFYMIVQKKTRDIGVLKSLGASGPGVAGMFILYGAAVGVVGAALGTGIGTVFVWYINDIQNFLTNLDPNLRVWSPEVYTFDRIPNVVKSSEAMWIGSIAILASMLGSLVPAILAARVWPVKALRYE